MKISLANDTVRERQTRDQLMALLQRHELQRWQFTDVVRIYPVVPVGLPEGAKSEFSSYLHLVIGYLEYAALIEVLGPDDARQVIEGWRQSRYTWIYAMVLRDFDIIGAIVARYNLLPG